jgi:glycosyltransferase involved in cell wall biosynthesis
MGKWIFALNVYQEEQLLPECLDSIKKACPEAFVVAVDGIYKSFAEEAHVLAGIAWSKGQMELGDEFERYNGDGASSDKTIEILRDYRVDRIITSGKPWANEWIKRSEYLRYGEPGDWLFVIDADERIEGTLPSVQEVERIGSPHLYVNLERDDGAGLYGVFRLHRWERNMIYDQTHYALWINGKLVNRRDYENVLLPNVVLKHRWLHRAQITPLRAEVKGAFYRRLVDRDERIFRDQHSGE